jgi:hypothetical protein
MAVCCQNLPLGALSSRSALSVLVGELFKKFSLFLNKGVRQLNVSSTAMLLLTPKKAVHRVTETLVLSKIELRPTVFWDVTLRGLVFVDGRFGQHLGLILKGQVVQEKLLEPLGLDREIVSNCRYPNYQSTLLKSPQQRRRQSHQCRSLTARA